MDLTKIMLNLALGGGTWVLGLLIFLSIASVAVMLERARIFYRGRFAEETFVSEIEPLLAAGAWSEAAACCETAPGFEPQVLLAGLRQVQRGRSAAEETMEAERIRLGQVLEKRLGFLGSLGANAPFIGLFGTVLGIIHAFKDLSLTEGGGGPAVMSGIAEALVATAVGLLVAIPAVMAYNFFHRRLHTILERSQRLSRILLTYLKSPVAVEDVPTIPLPLRKTGRLS
ncbi:MAG: MotA/TolQ/ExbB proton channel family protein [Deltaproteobacteria bacterium]|nr:MotA/TolQ/ExbB proton channel family protein [Deltaproteobacteria bacterium]